MKKLFRNSIIIATASLFVGCGNNGTGTTTVIPYVTSFGVSGSVVDGPIYGATVTIMGVDENKSIVYGTTTTDKDGTFNISDIKNLPKVYRVVISDGKDSGVDTKVDENDEDSSFDMSARVEREENNETKKSIANVSPATTIVDNLVEDGKMPLKDARDAVADSFGLDKGTPLCKLDNKKNSVGNKVGNLIASILKSLPVKDKKLIIKSITKMVKAKTIKVKVSDTRIDLSGLDLKAILSDINKTNPSAVSPDDIEKIAKVQQLVIDNISNLIEKIKTATEITGEQVKDALSQKIALDNILKQIALKNSLEVDVDVLKAIAYNTKESIKELLDNNESNLSKDKLDFISLLINANLDKNTSDIKKFIVKSSVIYKLIIKKIDKSGTLKHKIRIKHIVKLIFKNTDINQTENIKKALEDDKILSKLDDKAKDIDDKIVETGEIKDEVTNELDDTLANSIAGVIETGKIPTESDIDDIAKNTIDNPNVVEEIKVKIKIKIKIKIKSRTKVLTNDENKELLAINQLISSIKIHIKIKHTFTSVNRTNVDNYYKHIKTTIVVKHIVKIYNIINVNLNNTEDYNALSTKATTVINNLVLRTDIDIVKTINNVKNSSTDLDNITPIKKTPLKRTFILPQPTLDNMPKAFSEPVKVVI